MKMVVRISDRMRDRLSMENADKFFGITVFHFSDLLSEDIPGNHFIFLRRYSIEQCIEKMAVPQSRQAHPDRTSHR